MRTGGFSTFGAQLEAVDAEWFAATRAQTDVRLCATLDCSTGWTRERTLCTNATPTSLAGQCVGRTGELFAERACLNAVVACPRSADGALGYFSVGNPLPATFT